MKDKSYDKCLSLSVGLCNISGIITYVPDMLVHSMHDASMTWINSLPKLQDIVLVYGFSAIGLILYMTLPSVIAYLYLNLAASKKAKIEKKINIYNERWDI